MMTEAENEMIELPVNPAPLPWMTDDLILRAFHFAVEAHSEQKRKYTNEPYIYHPIAVADILHNAFKSDAPPPFIIAAALLHDVVEDCGVSFTTLRREFGDEVAVAVMHLTDLITHDQGNRETRKLLEAVRIGNAPLYAQLIKLADLISNTESITKHDKDFAVVYLKEKSVVLDYIAKSWNGNPTALLNDEAVALFQRAEGIFVSAQGVLASAPNGTVH